ncbi:MAG: hypothetical protein AAB383_05955 [Patescibacteria group bacterium]
MTEKPKEELIPTEQGTDALDPDDTSSGDWILAVNSLRDVRDRITGYVSKLSKVESE